MPKKEATTEDEKEELGSLERKELRQWLIGAGRNLLYWCIDGHCWNWFNNYYVSMLRPVLKQHPNLQPEAYFYDAYHQRTYYLHEGFLYFHDHITDL